MEKCVKNTESREKEGAKCGTKSSHQYISGVDNTPYDDAGKTLAFDCPALLIPVVNEIFDENYTGKEKIEFLRGEYLLNFWDESVEKSFNDAHFKIIGDDTKTYHMEFQSTWDNTMVLRMFEYDIGIALGESRLEENKLIIKLAKSAVLYLRHNKNVPDKLIVEIQTPGGNVSYDIPVLKTKEYTLEKIFEKKLLFLLPFYIFSYEKKFKELEEDEEKLQKLKDEYVKIQEHLRMLCETGELTEYEKNTIVSMTKKVVRNLTVKYDKVRKGVGSVMGGRVVMHEAKYFYQKGRKEERVNTEAAIKRAEAADKRAEAAEQENMRLKEIIRSLECKMVSQGV